MADTYTQEQLEAALANMPMDLTETEDQQFDGTDFSPFPRGAYEFMIVSEPELKKAQTGTLMLYNMQLKVDVDGKERMCWTNINIHPNTIKQVKSFLFCVNLHNKYKTLDALQVWSKPFAEELVGLTGKAYFDIDPNPGYKPKNVVKYWINEFAKAKRNEGGDDEISATPLNPDDLPF